MTTILVTASVLCESLVILSGLFCIYHLSRTSKNLVPFRFVWYIAYGALIAAASFGLWRYSSNNAFHAIELHQLAVEVFTPFVFVGFLYGALSSLAVGHTWVNTSNIVVSFMFNAICVALAVFKGNAIAQQTLDVLPLTTCAALIVFSLMSLVAKTRERRSRALFLLIAVLLFLIGDIIQKQKVEYPPLATHDLFHLVLALAELVLCHVATLAVLTQRRPAPVLNNK